MRTRSRSTRAVRFLLVVVLLGVVFHVAGGYYFATKLHADALAVDPWKWPQDLTVKSVDAATIALTDPGTPADDLRSPGTFGLLWDGGFGQVSGAPEIDGNTVTRDFTVLEGSPPSTGDAAGMDSFAFPAAPTAPIRRVTYDSPLGPMGAVFHPGASETWAVMVHGKGASPDEMFRMMRATSALGLPALSISYRNDLGEPRDPSQTYQYGRTEWRDLEAAVRYADDHGAADVVLVGASMGGAIIASFLQHSDLADEVRATVLDSPMLDFAETVAYGASQIGLVGGVPVPASLVWSAKEIAHLRYDVNWELLDYNDDVSWLRAPVLVFHGLADLTVPVESSRQLAARSGRVTLVEVPGAGHVESWNADPVSYEARMEAFLTRALQP